jgi:hypothetical protein
MCTITFWPRESGYALAMNRDEKIVRVRGLAPCVRRVAGRTVVFPSEPGGGTWIALNDTGATLALVNWYAINRRVTDGVVSRGDVVQAAKTAAAAAEAEAALKQLPLAQINPFRLVGVFPQTEQVVEWRWDLKKLRRLKHRWRPQQWISSGYDEPGAQRVRSRTFQRLRKEKSAGSPGWLRALHSSHLPERGPYSTCMHRPDAATVSYSEVWVQKAKSTLRYHDEALCQCGRLIAKELKRRRSVRRRSP